MADYIKLFFILFLNVFASPAFAKEYSSISQEVDCYTEYDTVREQRACREYVRDQREQDSRTDRNVTRNQRDCKLRAQRLRLGQGSLIEFQRLCEGTDPMVGPEYGGLNVPLSELDDLPERYYAGGYQEPVLLANGSIAVDHSYGHSPSVVQAPSERERQLEQENAELKAILDILASNE